MWLSIEGSLNVFLQVVSDEPTEGGHGHRVLEEDRALLKPAGQPWRTEQHHTAHAHAHTRTHTHAHAHAHAHAVIITQ